LNHPINKIMSSSSPPSNTSSQAGHWVVVKKNSSASTATVRGGVTSSSLPNQNQRDLDISLSSSTSSSNNVGRVPTTITGYSYGSYQTTPITSRSGGGGDIYSSPLSYSIPSSSLPSSSSGEGRVVRSVVSYGHHVPRKYGGDTMTTMSSYEVVLPSSASSGWN